MDPWLLALFLLLSPATSQLDAPEPLSFREFFDPKAHGLSPSARLNALVGKRVRLTGFMAHMESPPKGGFYLCAIPVFAAEGGAGTADLPPDAVFVIVSSAAGKELEHNPRALEVTGTLEVGSKTDEDGRVTRIRILLDRPRADSSVSPFIPSEVKP